MGPAEADYDDPNPEHAGGWPMILDCATTDTARASVAQILRMNVDDLRARLRACGPPSWPYDTDRVANAVAGVTEDDLPAQEAVHWVHATRVIDPSAFLCEGILPLRAMKPRLEQVLRELGSGLHHVGENPYAGSAGCKYDRYQQGPFAFLFKAVAIGAPESHHDYTATPEAVEDIAGTLLGANCEQLVARFTAISTPCIVTFRGPDDPPTMSNALEYLYYVEHGWTDVDAADAAITCFSGSGVAITPEQIVSVETLRHRR